MNTMNTTKCVLTTNETNTWKFGKQKAESIRQKIRKDAIDFAAEEGFEQVDIVGVKGDILESHKTRLHETSAESALPEGFEGFDHGQTTKRRDLKEPAFEVINTLKKGVTFKLGKSKWEVMKEHGITRYLIKAGTKGEKFYILDTISLDPLRFGVRQVLGGGSHYGDVVESGNISSVE
jgi:hypothetical protein